jgi:hypothetical protein
VALPVAGQQCSRRAKLPHENAEPDTLSVTPVAGRAPGRVSAVAVRSGESVEPGICERSRCLGGGERLGVSTLVGGRDVVLTNGASGGSRDRVVARADRPAQGPVELTGGGSRNGLAARTRRQR